MEYVIHKCAMLCFLYATLRIKPTAETQSKDKILERSRLFEESANVVK
jgi:hypothetical protein